MHDTHKMTERRSIESLNFIGHCLKHLQLYSSEVILIITNIKVSMMKLAFYFIQRLIKTFLFLPEGTEMK